MLNKIWFGLLAIGLVYGFGRAALQPLPQPPGDAEPRVAATAPTASEDADRTPEASRVAAMSDAGRRLTNAAIDSAETSVTICIGLIGMMALWLGIMKIAEDAGLVTLLARVLRPVLRWLFPEIPRGHAASGAIVMNMAANMLGLDNAATPLGLKAMRELQTLNPIKDTATNSMATFLAINTSSISLVAFSVIAYRKSVGSIDPASVVVAMLLATTCSTIVAIITSRSLQRFFPVTPSTEAASTNDATGADASTGDDAERRDG